MSEKYKDILDFVNSVKHDMLNILHTIKISVNIGQEMKEKKSNSAQMNEFIALINQQVDKGTNILRELEKVIFFYQ